MNSWRPGTIGQAQEPIHRAQQAPSRATFHVPSDTSTEASTEAPPAAPAIAASPFQTAPAVTELRGDIAASLFRMLQGKVVGRDVADDAGQLLAAEGTPITAELAERAEQAGVLPELVLHMAWPPELEP